MDSKIEALSASVDSRIEALSTSMDSKIEAMSASTDSKISESEQRMMAMMEAYFDPKFNLLAESIEAIQEKLIPQEVIEDHSDRLDVLEATVRHLSSEVSKLKKAQ